MSNLSQFFQSGSATPWVSGMTVRKNQIVKSPADNEEYERITATGSGTTDPADDVTNYVARSYVRVSALAPGILVGAASFIGSSKSATGSIAQGVRTSALSITGRGSIGFLAATKNATGTFRVEVIADGLTIMDETQTMTSSNSILCVGSPVWDGASASASAIRQSSGIVFRRSLQVYLTAVTTNAGSLCGVFYSARSEA